MMDAHNILTYYVCPSYVAYMYAYDIIVVQIIASMFTIMSAMFFFIYKFYCLLCKSKHSTNIPVRTLFPPPPPPLSQLTVLTTYLYMPHPTHTHQYTPPSSHNIVEPLYSGQPWDSLKCPD